MTYVKVVSEITNSRVKQAVIVIIIVVYVYKVEQKHISSPNNKEGLTLDLGYEPGVYV